MSCTVNTDPDAPDDLVDMRITLRKQGFRPVPISGPTMRVKGAGKRPLMTNWRAVCASADEAEIRRWASAEPTSINTGLLCGELVGLDIDVPLPQLATEIEALAGRMLPETSLRRIGSAPKSLLVYRAQQHFSKLETPELILAGGIKAQVEVLADGQQFVAFGVHCDTGQNYRWGPRSPLDTRLEELPVVSAEQVSAFVIAAKELLRAAGGRTSKEIEAAAQGVEDGGSHPGYLAPELQARPAAATRRGAAGTGFFLGVNRRAIADIAPWLQAIFPAAEYQPGTGAWRVSSAALHRDLQEDLSVHPRDGGRDFGEGKSCSAIDIVMRHGGVSTAQDAAFFICEKLGIDPTELGWREPKGSQHKRAGAGSPADLEDFDLTEDGVALAFGVKHANDLRFDHTRGAWFRWTGTFWAHETTKLAFSWARLICRQLARDANDDKVKAILAKAATSAAVERFAQADRGFAVTSDIWDRDTFLLGTPGGVVDLRTGALRPARQSDYITKLTSVAPAGHSECPIWSQFLIEATAGDQTLIAFLQQFCGYLLTGDTREHALLFVYGPGGNGKSVWLNTVAGILADYCRTSAMETFTASQGDRHPTDLAMLRGARLVCASETEEGRAWAETRIKQLTGGDTITARFMRQDFFEFRPQFKLVVIGNHQPVLRNVDAAARRRFNVVPFVHKPERPDRQLEEKLRAEWPAILRWMVEGCLSWQRDGLIRPQVVLNATAEYFSEQDSVRQWLDECCDQGGRSLSETVAALFKSWTEYALANGEKPGTTKWFTQALVRQELEPIRDTPGNRNKRGFLGVQLKLIDTSDHWQNRADADGLPF